MTIEAWIPLIILAVSMLGGGLGLVYRHGRVMGCLNEFKRRVETLEATQTRFDIAINEIRDSIARMETLLTKKLK